MKRLLSTWAMMLLATAAQAQPALGPGEQGATLRSGPAEPATPKVAPTAPVRSTPMPSTYPFDYSLDAKTSPFPFTNLPTQPKSAPPRFNQTDINKDIEATKDTGPWLIHVMTYTGEKAPMQARAFVKLLREEYKYNAHVFNYGAAEKAAEYKRALDEVNRQREALRKDGLDADVPLRIRVSHIPENTTVFIGGFASREEAEQVLKTHVRKLPVPDPKKVDLDMKYVAKETIEEKGSAKVVRSEELSKTYKNPFASAFVVRNPALPPEQQKSTREEEVRFLRKVNEGEPFSLLQCKKAFTLAIAQYRTMTVLQESQHEAKGFLDKFMLKKQVESIDHAAHNAHNLADAFRKTGMPETYVLHARNCSYVTVGGYDSPSDPNLLSMQRYLEEQFRRDGWQSFQLMPRPMPMEVPH